MKGRLELDAQTAGETTYLLHDARNGLSLRGIGRGEASETASGHDSWLKDGAGLLDVVHDAQKLTAIEGLASLDCSAV